ncbi:Uncharacterised protein [Chlamydia trachomatis]|nr:Uncharacterised protein [Chlamydia trachomatis]
MSPIWSRRIFALYAISIEIASDALNGKSATGPLAAALAAGAAETTFAAGAAGAVVASAVLLAS